MSMQTRSAKIVGQSAGSKPTAVDASSSNVDSNTIDEIEDDARSFSESVASSAIVSVNGGTRERAACGLEKVLENHEKRKDHFVIVFPSDQKVQVVQFEHIWQLNRQSNFLRGGFEAYPRFKPYKDRKTAATNKYEGEYLQKGDKIMCSCLGDDGREIRRKNGKKGAQKVVYWTAQVEFVSNSRDNVDEAVKLATDRIELEKKLKALEKEHPRPRNAKPVLKVPSKVTKSGGAVPRDKQSLTQMASKLQGSSAPGQDTPDVENRVSATQTLLDSASAEGIQAVFRKRANAHGMMTVEQKKRFKCMQSKTLPVSYGEKASSTYKRLVDLGILYRGEYLISGTKKDVNRRRDYLKTPCVTPTDQNLDISDATSPWFWQESGDKKRLFVEGYQVYIDDGIDSVLKSYKAGQLSCEELTWYVMLHLIGGEEGLLRMAVIYEDIKDEMAKASEDKTKEPRIMKFAETLFGKQLFNAIELYLEDESYGVINLLDCPDQPKGMLPRNYARFMNDKLNIWITQEKKNFLRQRPDLFKKLEETAELEKENDAESAETDAINSESSTPEKGTSSTDGSDENSESENTVSG